MSFAYKKTRTESGAKCPACGRGLQHGGYLLEWDGASTVPICGFCLVTVEGANAKGQIITKEKIS